MPRKRLTTEEFIEKARKVHGDKYSFERTAYKGCRTKVVVTCDVHGDFLISPINFLSGHGCYKCARKSSPYNIGVNDMMPPYNKKYYEIWMSMLSRCYNTRGSHQTYEGCIVDYKWLRFSSFYKFCEKNYKEGYHLDKDILAIKGLKIYSEETCCFVPPAINILLTKNNKGRGSLPIGVQRNPERTDRPYVSEIREYGKKRKIGSFKTIEDAFAAYKSAKEAHIKRVAKEYFQSGRISKRVYDALMSYEVEITD